MNHILSDSTLSEATPVIDWKPSIDRLRSEADTAAREGRANPYSEIEAECWLDLIDAEIAAQRAFDQARPEVVAALQHLNAWRTELLLILRKLRRSGTAENFARRPLDVQKDRNQINFRRPPEVGPALSRG